MNDEVWDQSTAWDEMLRVVWSGFLPYRPSPRKFRLWTVACCRAILAARHSNPRLVDLPAWVDGNVPEWEAQLNAAERFADDEINRAELHAARSRTGGPWNAFNSVVFHSRLAPDELSRIYGSFSTEYGSPTVGEMAALLRDIFGNPFRPVAFDPRWHTEHTIGIAAKMYDDREFAAMPILADALEETGCDSESILSHCREPGVHVRGCWVVDLVLEKS